jgi:hypothetical protein
MVTLLKATGVLALIEVDGDAFFLDILSDFGCTAIALA